VKIQKKSKIYIAGGYGMVGSAIERRLLDSGYNNIIKTSSRELDLRNQNNVRQFLNDVEIDYVILAAARVGGILSNAEHPANYLYDNLMIQTNIIHESFKAGINSLFFLGSSCIYPKYADQPIKEESLLSGYLEKTNLEYSLAKISGIKMCEAYNKQYGVDYRSVMPTNLYGPNDNYDEQSHVIPALIMKIYKAYLNHDKIVPIWGTGLARREFMHVDDLSLACSHIMNLTQEEYYNIVSKDLSHINIGVGCDISIKNLAILISQIIGYKGNLEFDTSKPDGTPRKLLDSSKLYLLGWSPTIELKEGLTKTIKDYIKQ